MKARALSVLAVALFMFAVSVPIFAHHGTAAYDVSKMFTVKGKIVRFDFVNPHVQVFFEVTGEKAPEQWQAELTSPNHLIRAGWSKDSLKPGDEISITGFRTKDGSNSIWISKIYLRGEELKVGSE